MHFGLRNQGQSDFSVLSGAPLQNSERNISCKQNQMLTKIQDGFPRSLLNPLHGVTFVFRRLTEREGVSQRF